MRDMRTMRRWMSGAMMLAMALLAPAAALGEPLVENGQTIAFLGDSITREGAATQGGYARLVISGLEANGIKTTPVYAGIGGHKSNQMLARLQKDVQDKNPDWMTLSCGVNDVWHGDRGVALEDYKKNITAIVDQAQAAGVKVVLLTSTMIGEDAENENNRKLEAYNAFLRELAAEKNLPLADLNTNMQTAVQAANQASNRPGNKLTRDGVHMNLEGNLMMATGLLQALGLNDEQLDKARQHWLDLSGVADVALKLPLTLRQYEALAPLAETKGQSIEQMLQADLQQAVQDRLNTPAGE